MRNQTHPHVDQAIHQLARKTCYLLEFRAGTSMHQTPQKSITDLQGTRPTQSFIWILATGMNRGVGAGDYYTQNIHLTVSAT